MLFWSSRSERICFCSDEESLNDDGPAPESVLAGAAVASSLDVVVSSLELSLGVDVSSLELSLAR